MATQAVKRNVLQQFVERASSLYTLPAVAMEVLELTGQPNVDTVALRQCVERDPALTAKLLRVVNSSMFGLSREVSDLTQALALLGVKPLKLLVLGFSLPKELYGGVEAETLQRFWRFALVKAVASRELSKAFWNNSGDEAFIAGLLQEIGILVLVNELGNSYMNFLSGVQARGENLNALETATLGFDHAILSARLLDHWNLPESIVQAVAVPHVIEHIKSLEADEAVLPQTLHLATLIASIIVNDRCDLMNELLQAAEQYRGINVEQINELLDQLQEQVAVMASLFSVSIDEQISYRDVMGRAHEQMSEAAIDALPQMIGGLRDEPIFVEQEALHAAIDQYAQSYLDIPEPARPRNPHPPAVSDRPVKVEVAAAVSGASPSYSDSSVDPGLQGRIFAAITASLSRQRELSLGLVEIDGYEDMLVMYGPDRALQMVAALRRAIKLLSDIPCESVIVSDIRVAVVLTDCDRQQAVNLMRSLNDAVPEWLLEQGEADTPITFSTGIASLATPTRSSRPEDLIAAADRCLFAAKRSGGAIKSIDLL